MNDQTFADYISGIARCCILTFVTRMIAPWNEDCSVHSSTGSGVGITQRKRVFTIFRMWMVGQSTFWSKYETAQIASKIFKIESDLNVFRNKHDSLIEDLVFKESSKDGL